MISRPRRFTAKLSYQGKPFTSIPIEVSPVEAGNADHHDRVTSEALALVGLPNSSPVPCTTLPGQVAQKIHACTDPVREPRRNDRAHDLVDLQLLEALIVNESLGEVRRASIAVFAKRERHAWPPTVVAHSHWSPIYAGALEGLEDLGLAASVEEAALRVQAFIDRVDESSD